MVALVPTVTETKEEFVDRKIAVKQQLAESLGDSVADNDPISLPIFEGATFTPKRKRLRERTKKILYFFN